jgi:LysR family transcriptional activator of glutamate synthase operon
MDFRQLELFVAVMEQASVTRAAEKVYLSPGALSRQIHKLASELRVDLFVHQGKRLVPTPAARQLLESAKAVMRQIREIEQGFSGDPATDTRPFHFATGLTTLVNRLGPALRKLRREMPHTPIRITVVPTEEMVSGLLDRRFDLALISLPVSEEQLTILPLFEEELLIMRPSPAPVRGWHVGNIKLAEVASASYLLYPKRSNMRTVIDRYFEELGIAPRVIMEADDTEAIRLLVESGFGCSILPEFALRKQPRRFHTLRLPERPLMRRQALAMARTEFPRPLTLSVAKFLQAAISSSATDEHR